MAADGDLGNGGKGQGADPSPTPPPPHPRNQETKSLRNSMKASHRRVTTVEPRLGTPWGSDTEL